MSDGIYTIASSKIFSINTDDIFVNTTCRQLKKIYILHEIIILLLLYQMIGSLVIYEDYWEIIKYKF